ncbi:unnamed protein product [Linum tenue]|uniref:Uncharacterized protein n=1 Tax=Linum tenue TaxID=586396 RepID=A0AAV0Q631_9ROSI|nr:unnamed protein product [Linum tenue]
MGRKRDRKVDLDHSFCYFKYQQLTHPNKCYNYVLDSFTLTLRSSISLKHYNYLVD